MKKDIIISIRYAILFTMIMLLIDEVNWRQFINELNLYYIFKALFILLLSGGLYLLVLRGQRKKKRIKEDT